MIAAINFFFSFFCKKFFLEAKEIHVDHSQRIVRFSPQNLRKGFPIYIGDHKSSEWRKSWKLRAMRDSDSE